MSEEADFERLQRLLDCAFAERCADDDDEAALSSEEEASFEILLPPDATYKVD